MIDSTSKLNEDVMRLIVECVAREEPLPRTKRDLKAAAQPLAWIRLSHVCQRWRKIVLGMGELWADNVIAIPGIYDTFLSRAADWPLSISIAPDTSIPKLIKLEIVDFMSKHLERVGRLDLHEHTVHIWPPNFLQDRALPRLHTLRLVDPPGEYRENVHINAPALRSAHIPRTPVTLYAPKLTHLTLGHLPNPPRLLFDTLSSSPRLEALSILFEGIGPNPWAECTSEPLYLENIKFIDLKGDSTTDLPAFFRLVRWPVTARTEIWWKESTRTAETFDETIDALAPYMYIPSRDTLRLCEDNTTSGAFACTLVLSASNTSTVGISKPGDFSFRSYGWLFSLDDEFEDAIGDPSNYTAVGMKWLSCLPRALYQIPEDQIRHIDFSSFPYFQGSGPAADALRRFDLTKTIRVDARSVVAGDILGRLLVPMPSFPALDEITLFVNHGLHHIAVAPWWRKVRSALRTRSDGGRQVRRLTICGARREDDNPEIAQAQPWAEVLVDAREPGK